MAPGRTALVAHGRGSRRVNAAPLPRHRQVGTRTLAALQRDLVAVPLSLADAIGRRPPPLPPLPRDAQGYLITALPDNCNPAISAGADSMIPYVRQRYVRHWVDLT